MPSLILVNLFSLNRRDEKIFFPRKKSRFSGDEMKKRESERCFLMHWCDGVACLIKSMLEGSGRVVLTVVILLISRFY